MKTFQYFNRKIKALTADKPACLEASLFEELSDSETSKIVGGASNAYQTITMAAQDTINFTRYQSILSQQIGQQTAMSAANEAAGQALKNSGQAMHQLV